jgi:hypothetical protein
MNWTSPTQKNVSYGEDLFQAKMQAFDASLEAEKREHERITALNPFELEALNRKKGALEGTLQEYKDLCKGVIDCPWEREINKISDEIDVLTKQIDGREEWLAQVGKMSETELTRQEQKYQKFVDMASMSDFCYKDAKSLPDPPAGWTEIKMDNSPLGRIMAEANSHDDAGFQCSLLYNEQTGKYVLAFRGTEFGRELIDDGVRADGFGSIWESEQTRLAKKTVDDLMILGKINKEDLELTGHSLGGGLAAEAAIEYHLTAYTFNPKGISDVTHEKIAQNNYNYNGIIHNVVATNDPIQKIQNGFSEYVAPAFNVAKDMTPLIHPAFSLMTKKTNPINVRPIGGFTTIKEAYGNGGEGHRIPFIRQALTLRHNDIVKQQNKQ